VHSAQEFEPTVVPTFNGSVSKKSKIGIVIGITMGITRGLLCIISVFLRWRRRDRELTDVEVDNVGFDVEEDEATIRVIYSKLKIFSYEDMGQFIRALFQMVKW